MEEKSRVEWIDIAKGIAIIMVVLGHAVRDDMRSEFVFLDIVYKCFYVFHMSFFFFLSGYTYRIAGKKYGVNVTMLRKKVKSMLLPWVAYSIFIYIVFTVAHQLPGIGNLLEQSGNYKLTVSSYTLMCLQADNPYAFHLWFIYVLFIITLLWMLIEKCSFGKKRVAQSISAVVVLSSLFLVGYGFLPFLGDWNSLMYYLVRYIPYFALGFSVNLEEYIKNKSNWIMRLLAVFGTIYIFIRAYFFAGNGNQIIGATKGIRVIVAYIGYLLLPFVMLELCRLSNVLSNSSLKTAKVLKIAGRYSFTIYLWHQPFCCAMPGLILYVKFGLPAGISIAISTVMSFVMAFVIEKVKALMRRMRRIKKCS